VGAPLGSGDLNLAFPCQAGMIPNPETAKFAFGRAGEPVLKKAAGA